MEELTRTCKKCGWVAFGVSRKYAEEAVKRFNEFYHGADKAVQDMYAGPATLKDYEYCVKCGGPYFNFRDSLPGDCPAGCTLNPIINEEKI